MSDSPGGRPATVLNVDDSDAGRLAISHILRQAGFEVREARNGRQALALAADQPDLILLDVNLPDLDGFEVGARLKADPATASIPLFYLSGAFVTSADRVRGLECGADGYLTKPADPRELVACLQALLRARQSEARAARAEAEAERQRAVTVLESISDAFASFDQDARILYANDKALALVGKARDEVLGKTLWEVYPPVSDARFGAEFRRVLAERVAVTYEAFSGDHDRHFSLLLTPSGGGVLVFCRDITAQKRAEEARARLAAIVESSDDAILAADLDGVIRGWNGGAERLYGYSAAEACGRPAAFLSPDDRAGELPGLMGQVLRGGHVAPCETVQVRKDGRRVDVSLSLSAIRDPGGAVTGLSAIVRDMTERQRLEEQYRQAQKMEAVGRLAGGVAHDFNNLLTVITGYGDLVLGRLRPGDPARELIGEITRAGERAAALTRQLLLFSRKQVVTPVVLDLNAVIRDLENLLRRLIGEDVELTASLQPGLGAIKADAGHVEQVLMNLAVNARDAMPQGGKLTIATRDVELGPAYKAAHPGAPDVSTSPSTFAAETKACVLLSVSDTGHGMTEEVKARIFEPFFTTKEVGKGTGLGLATVYGIVKQTGGHVEVSSAPERGTTFRLYFPRAESSARAGRSHQGHHPAVGGGETILLAEDEEAVRLLTRHVLKSHGYHVLVAAHGQEALRIGERYEGPLHLLVTDVVMPDLGGRALAERLVALRPDIRVLYLSGYTEDEVVRHGVSHEEVNFLQKPFTPAALAQKVREVLDGTLGG